MDRSYTPDREDFLTLFLSSDKTKKIIYKLPHKLYNKEVFKLKICKKGISDLIKKKEEEMKLKKELVEKKENESKEIVDLDIIKERFERKKKEQEDYNLKIEEILKKNCLGDIYNTSVLVDYTLSLPLEQIQIYNIYKICHFGYRFQEGERSFLDASNSEIQFSHRLNELKRDNFYYFNIDEIIEIFEEAEVKNFREYLEKNESSRCILEFVDHFEGFDLEKFENKSFFHIGDEIKSDFIIEYNFDEDMIFENPIIEDFQLEDVDTVTKIKSRDDIIKSMENKFVFIDKKFTLAKIEMSILSDKEIKEDENIKSFKMNLHKIEKETKLLIKDSTVDSYIGFKMKINGNDNGSSFYTIEIPNNSYIRYVPLICFKELDHDNIYSYEFFGDKQCLSLSTEKILLGKKENNLTFIKKDQNQIIQTNKINLNFDEFDLSFYSKDKPDIKVTIKGFKSKCDAIFDKSTSLFYHICYQNNSSIRHHKLNLNHLSDDLFYLKYKYSVNHYPNLFYLKQNHKNLQNTELGKKESKENFGLLFELGIFSAVIGGILLIMTPYIAIGIILLVFCGLFIALFAFSVVNDQTRLMKFSEKKIKKMKKSALEKILINPFLFENNEVVMKEDENMVIAFVVAEVGKNVDVGPRVDKVLKIIKGDDKNEKVNGNKRVIGKLPKNDYSGFHVVV